MDQRASPRILFIHEAASGARGSSLRFFPPLIRAIFRHALGEGLCYPWPRTLHVPMLRLRNRLSMRSGTVVSPIQGLSTRYVGPIGLANTSWG